jgi:hypothetical protein
MKTAAEVHPVLRSTKGIGLAGVLVAIALICIGAFTLIQISQNFVQDSRRSQVQMAARNLERVMLMALADPPTSLTSDDSLCQKLLRGRKLTAGNPIVLQANELFAAAPELRSAIGSVTTPETRGAVSLQSVTVEANDSAPMSPSFRMQIQIGNEIISRRFGLSTTFNSNKAISDCTSNLGAIDMANDCNVDLSCDDVIPNAVFYPKKGKKFPEPLTFNGVPVCSIGFEANNLNDQTFEIDTRTGEPTKDIIQIAFEFATYGYPNSVYVDYFHLARNRWEYLFHECNIRTDAEGWGCVHRPPESSIRHRWLRLPAGVTKLRFRFPGPSPFFIKINSGCDFTTPPLTYGNKLRLFADWYPENPVNDDAPSYPWREYCPPN